MGKQEGDGTTAKVRRAKAKQDDLPGVEASSRKIQELEDLGDALADLEDEKSAIAEKVKDANENLVAAMKRKDKTYYSRPTWGTIILGESKVSAKVKKASMGGSTDADE